MDCDERERQTQSRYETDLHWFSLQPFKMTLRWSKRLRRVPSRERRISSQRPLGQAVSISQGKVPGRIPVAKACMAENYREFGYLAPLPKHALAPLPRTPHTLR